MAEWREKQNPSICWPQETHFRCQDKQNESEGMEKVFHANRNQKEGRVVIHISDKIDIKMKTIIRNKGLYIITKRSIMLEHIMFMYPTWEHLNI